MFSDLGEQISSVISHEITTRNEFTMLMTKGESTQSVQHAGINRSTERKFGQCRQMISDGKRAQQMANSTMQSNLDEINATNTNLKFN